jgi:hypothetical protein
MTTEAELLIQGKNEELWQKCCGFIDLSLEGCMKVQERLLREQLEMLKNCKLGRSIMKGAEPETMEEFRRQVPLTTYADYEPFLLTKNEKALPQKPLFWQHTSGRSGEYPFKWVPVTARQFAELRSLLFACLTFACSRQKGDINYKRNDKFLYALAPPPYTTGALIHAAPHELFDFLPPVKAAESMSFEERVQLGFKMALGEGLDLFFALSSVLVAIGERLTQSNQKLDIKPLLKNPSALARLLKGLLKSKLARRSLMPKDLWKLKGIVSTGSDGSVFREKVKEMWGRYPLDVYGGTEGIIMATQTWDYEGMTFIPHLNFLEFIPEMESLKSRDDPFYHPETLLLDEIAAGEKYELAITNFYGGPLIRYKLGDMIKITALRNEKLGIDIPQMAFHARVDDMIDIAGFTRLTEKVIWQAIENSGVAYKEWAVRKEVRERPILHLYLELGENGHVTEEQIAESVHRALKRLDAPYADLESFLGLRPLEVTILPKNAFQNYTKKQQAAGTDLAHLKPPHINPSDGIIDCLVGNGAKKPATRRKEVKEPEKVLK